MDSLFQIAKTRSHLLLLVKCQDSNEIIGYYSSTSYKDKVTEGLHILYCIHTKSLEIDEYILLKIYIVIFLLFLSSYIMLKWVVNKSCMLFLGIRCFCLV